MVQMDIQELFERGFDLDALKAKACGVTDGMNIYRYTYSYKNPVGVEVLCFDKVGEVDGRA